MRSSAGKLVMLAVLCAAGLPGGAAFADVAPQWTVTSVSRPTNLGLGVPAGQDSYRVTVTNTGGAASDGSAIQITDELPDGLTIDPAGATGEDLLSKAKLACIDRTCTYDRVVVPDEVLVLTFPVDVVTGARSPLVNVVHVSGGGAPDASMSTPTTISNTPAHFGISAGGATTALSSTQAGAHPDITTSIAFNTVNSEGALAEAVKDTTDTLPPGFAGDLVDTPTCPLSLFAHEGCPTNTQVGIAFLALRLQGKQSLSSLEPVYNLAPNPGAVAKLGFSALAVFGVQGDVTVRPEDYGLSVAFQNVAESQVELDGVSLTVWGVPADPIHDPLRSTGGLNGLFGASSAGSARVPFFTNPTSCDGGPLVAGFTSDSWEAPGVDASTQMQLGPLTGCDRLGMEPAVTAVPTSDAAYAPTGLQLDMSIPQTYENPDGLATSTLKKEVVTLPEGMTVNPSAGAGLGACTQAEYEAEAVQYVSGHGCPNDSKLGTVKVLSPSIAEEVLGSVYLAQPYTNQFGSLLALYVVARIPARGVLLKLAGKVEPNAATGQLVTTFDDLPPLPFKLASFSFNQGANAPLVTPPTCGSYTVDAALTPLSAADSPPLMPLVPPFEITANCPAGGLAPFAPQAIAGTTDNAAGSYSPLYVRIVRNDGEQELTGFSSQLPPGLTANLSGVPFCPETDIAIARSKSGAQEEAQPSCPAASQIGHTLVGAGVGPVLAQAPGRLYMGGPFEGAPFSVIAITSAKVGPFDLGTVVVHLPLDIDPQTAAVTIPAGAADQIPHIIDGIVVHVRDIRVYVDRPGFTLNPTSCAPMRFAATVTGSGASFTSAADDVPVTVSDPYQLADCSNLAFKPSFKVSSAAKTSRADGASLSVKLAYPAGSLGAEANIHEVRVELPKRLPSRLSTLQKACTATQFQANPAGCPAASIVGHARAITPILPVALEGPAYFVSHGGEAFPSLIVVLQGYGVTIDLVGSTFISKTGITSSTFKSVPDQPVTSFALTLPRGPFSALTAVGNLCKGKLIMPTTFTAQNGLELHQRTRIAVAGCQKKKSVRRHRRAKRK
jgi:uncharacterized repeat protein (TIGR01451 family)